MESKKFMSAFCAAPVLYQETGDGYGQVRVVSVRAFVTKAGVVDTSTSERSKCYFSINVQNRHEALCKLMGLDPNEIWSARNGDDAYTVVRVFATGYDAERIVKYVKGGDEIEVLGALRVNEYQGRKSLQLTMYGFTFGRKAARRDEAEAAAKEGSPADAEPESKAEAETPRAPEIDESEDEDDLPF